MPLGTTTRAAYLAAAGPQISGGHLIGGLAIRTNEKHDGRESPLAMERRFWHGLALTLGTHG